MAQICWLLSSVEETETRADEGSCFLPFDLESSGAEVRRNPLTAFLCLSFTNDTMGRSAPSRTWVCKGHSLIHSMCLVKITSLILKIPLSQVTPVSNGFPLIQELCRYHSSVSSLLELHALSFLH